MKFGEYLSKEQHAEWSQHYLNYSSLKDLINQAEADQSVPLGSSPREASLTVLRHGGTNGASADEKFFALLDDEVSNYSFHLPAMCSLVVIVSTLPPPLLLFFGLSSIKMLAIQQNLPMGIVTVDFQFLCDWHVIFARSNVAIARITLLKSISILSFDAQTVINEKLLTMIVKKHG